MKLAQRFQETDFPQNTSLQVPDQKENTSLLAHQIKTDIVTILDPNITPENAREVLEQTYGQTRYRNYVEEIRRRKFKEKRTVAHQERIVSLKNENLTTEDFVNRANQEKLIPLGEYLMFQFAKGDIQTAKNNLTEFIEDLLSRHNLNLQKDFKEQLKIHLKNVRLGEILYCCPPEVDKQEFVYQVIQKLISLLAELLTSSYENCKDKKNCMRMADIYLAKILYPGYNIEYRLGFGGSEDPVNVRSCSYLLPALTEMQRFLELGLTPPTLVITHGGSLAIECNGMDPKKVDENKQEILNLCSTFIADIYPNLANFVRFEEFEAEDLNSERIQTRVNLLRNLTATAQERQDDFLDYLRTLGLDISLTDLQGLISNFKNPDKQTKKLIQTIDFHRFAFDFSNSSSDTKDSIRKDVILMLKLETAKLFKNIPLQSQIANLINQLSESLEIDINNLFTNTPPTTKEKIVEILEKYFGKLSDKITVLANQKKVAHSIQVLVRLGQNHGSQSNDATFLYAAVHPDEKVFGDILPFKPKPVHAVVKFGGCGENNFNTIQRWLAENNQDPNSYRPNTTFGEDPFPVYRELNIGGTPPVYYNAGEEEVSISNLTKFNSWAEVIEHYRGKCPKCLRDILALDERYYHFLIRYNESRI